MSTIFYTESTPLSNSATGAAATVTATLTATTGRTAYLNGFVVSGLGATAGQASAVTVTGVLGGTQTYQFSVPTGATVAATPMQINFANTPLVATGPNTNIVVSVVSFGAGNTNANVTAYGFLK